MACVLAKTVQNGFPFHHVLRDGRKGRDDPPCSAKACHSGSRHTVIRQTHELMGLLMTRPAQSDFDNTNSSTQVFTPATFAKNSALCMVGPIQGMYSSPGVRDAPTILLKHGSSRNIQKPCFLRSWRPWLAAPKHTTPDCGIKYAEPSMP